MTRVIGDSPQTQEPTPLARRLIDRISATGPISVRSYMQACLADPDHGYYRTQTAIGRSGDFITAPEISQTFGEIIGLWSAITWQQMGSPRSINLIELGPGRGTLMRDALRAASIVPAFARAISCHLVEINHHLRDVQRQALAGSNADLIWHDTLESVPPGPAILIANEFLDALPCAQWQHANNDWSERQVGHTDGTLFFLAERQTPTFDVARLPTGDRDRQPRGPVIWMQHDFDTLGEALGARASEAPLAALFIDYGHLDHAWGDTLQAVRNHRIEHPLTAPGKADLSVAVDFAQFKYTVENQHLRAKGRRELATDGGVSQATFLGQLGIIERAGKLAGSNPSRAADIEAAIARLLSPTGMGTRFKAMGVRSANLPPLAGL